jgi:hypothetical protein
MPGGRQLEPGVPIALASGGLIGEARRQDRLILRRQWSLLAETPGLGRVESRLASDPGNADTEPLPGEIGIFRIIERPGGGQAGHQRSRNCNDRDCVPAQHVFPLEIDPLPAARDARGVWDTVVSWCRKKEIGAGGRSLPTASSLSDYSKGELGTSRSRQLARTIQQLPDVRKHAGPPGTIGPGPDRN